MTARTLRVLAVAAAATTGLAAPARAETTTSGQITGTVVRAALVGDATVVVRRPDRGVPRLELRRPGQKTQTLVNLPKGAESFELAAGAGAIAVSSYVPRPFDDYVDQSGRGGATQVLVGPLGGPLRAVATCPVSVAAPAVAVDGTQVAWADGGCAGPSKATEVGPAAIAVASADPAVAVQRTPVPQDMLPGSLLLQGDHGVAGVLRPTFFGRSTDVRTFGPEGLGDPRVHASGIISAPFGQRADGSLLVFRLRSGLTTDQDEYFDPYDGDCESGIGEVAPGADVQAGVGVGGCPTSRGYDLTSPATLVADQIVTRIDPGEGDRFEQLYRRDLDLNGLDVLRVTRTPVDGAPVLVARTDFRALDDVMADGARTGFSAIRCAGGTQLTVTDQPVGLIPDCAGTITTRRARVVKGGVALTVSCPRGCSGALVDDSYCGRRTPTAFHLAPGTHVVRLRPQVRTLRRKRLLVRLKLRGAPSPRQVVRLSS